MKILIVTQYFYPEIFAINEIVFELAKYGHDVSVLTGRPNYGAGKVYSDWQETTYEEVKGVKILRVSNKPRTKNPFSIYSNYLSFWKLAKKRVNALDNDFDVVMSFSLSPVISISPANKYAKKHKIKHLLFCLDLWPESVVITRAVLKYSPVYWGLYLWSKFIYKQIDKILITSPSFEEYFRKVLLLKKSDIEHSYQPILIKQAIDNFKPFNNESFNIVYAGNIGKLQLLMPLLKGIEQLKNSNVHLTLIGGGSLYNKIKKYVAKNKLDNNVSVLGFMPVEKVATYYKNADALLIGLKDSGYVGKTIPSKLNQYLYYGKPIVACIGGDGKKLLEDSKGAILLDFNSKTLANELEKISKMSKQELSVLGANNLKYYNQNLDNEKIYKFIEQELYKLSK